MPTGIDELSNALHASGHYVLEKCLEDKRSHEKIGHGAYRGLVVRSVINDLSNSGRASLERYLEEHDKPNVNIFDYLLITLQEMHVFTEDDSRFKEEFKQSYFRIYEAYSKKDPANIEKEEREEQIRALKRHAQAPVNQA